MYSYVPQDADQAKPNDGGNVFLMALDFSTKETMQGSLISIYYINLFISFRNGLGWPLHERLQELI